jgi:hypothetical protein
MTGKKFADSQMRMKKLSLFVCTILLAVVPAACSSPIEPSEPTAVTLAPGQTTQVGGLAVKFVGVTIDTRCPADVMCIQMGDAFVALETISGVGHRAFELQLLNPTKRATTQGSYSIELTELNPYPFLSRPISPSDYRVTLTITRV